MQKISLLNHEGFSLDLWFWSFGQNLGSIQDWRFKSTQINYSKFHILQIQIKGLLTPVGRTTSWLTTYSGSVAVLTMLDQFQIGETIYPIVWVDGCWLLFFVLLRVPLTFLTRSGSGVGSCLPTTQDLNSNLLSS